MTVNRYVALGVIQDLIDGNTVRLVSTPLDKARAHYYAVLVAIQEQCPELIQHVSRAHGREGIVTRTGGALDYSSPLACRGYTGTVVAFDVHTMTRQERACITVKELITC